MDVRVTVSYMLRGKIVTRRTMLKYTRAHRWTQYMNCWYTRDGAVAKPIWLRRDDGSIRLVFTVAGPPAKQKPTKRKRK